MMRGTISRKSELLKTQPQYGDMYRLKVWDNFSFRGLHISVVLWQEPENSTFTILLKAQIEIF